MPITPMRLSTALREAGLYKAFAAALDGDDDFTAHAALYWFASDYHGGQDCPLYAILSLSDYCPGALERECPEDAMPLYDSFREAWEAKR